MGISVPANATTIDRIRQIHGGAVANELVQFKSESDRWGFKANGYISNANYSVKRTALLLFINHRSVESSVIKKAIEQTYSTFLPKGGHPFIYLSLEIEPHRVDVNIHPTKREVNFLHEEEIVEAICDEVRSRLGKVDTSRTFMTQSLLPGGRVPIAKAAYPDKVTPGTPTTQQSDNTRNQTPKPTIQKPYENNLVRTDASARKITTMLPPAQRPASHNNVPEDDSEEMQYEYSEKEATLCRLTTIKELRAEVRENMHGELTDLFVTHTFVGFVDERRRVAAIQSGVKLYLVDCGMICNEYFYQIGLTDFGNFGSIQFNPPLDLHELLTVAATQEMKLSEPNTEFDWEDAVLLVREKIISRADMLSEYFCMEVSDDGKLLSIPLLVKGYMPSLAKLPRFLLRLGPHVNWLEEKDCFHTFLRELASFYTPEALPVPSVRDDDPEGNEAEAELEAGPQAEVEDDPELAARRKHIAQALENILFPMFKARLVATKGLLDGVCEIANLKGLYRVFERC